MKKMKFYALICIFIGILSWLVGYLIVSNSESFEFTKRYISENPKVVQSVGQIKSIRLGLLGYWLFYKNGEASARFRVVLTGDRKSADAYVSLIQIAGNWKVQSSELIDDDGSVIPLDP